MNLSLFNVRFFILNLGIVACAIFCFPNFKSLPYGLNFQLVSVGIYLLSFLTLDLNFSKLSTRANLGALFLTFSCYYFIDAFTLYRASLHLNELIFISTLGGDLVTTFREVGIAPAVGVFLLMSPILIFLFASWLYKATSIRPWLVPSRLKFVSAFALVWLTATYMTEQYIHREDAFYFLRAHKLPLYLETFISDWQKFEFSESPSQEELGRTIKSVSPATNPSNILLIVLAGVPPEAITRDATPYLFSFAHQGTQFPNAMTEAISTHLAMNTLLFNRPPYSFEEDVKFHNSIHSAALPFEIYKKSGYRIYIGISTDFTMKQDEARALGDRATVDQYFNGFQGRNVGRNIADNATAEKAVQWLHQDNQKKPFLMTLQFDCTHWPYDFDATNEVFKPFLTADRLDKFDSPDRNQLVLNRYKNSLRQLDGNLQRVLSALTRTGLQKKTAVIIVSDHGENFSKGFVTHLNLSENSKKITSILYLPQKSLSPNYGFVTHQDIWPTLLEFTGISFSNGKSPFYGHSLLKPGYRRDHLLTMNGNLRLAEMTYSDKVIYFRTVVDGKKLFISPYLITDKKGVPLADWRDRLARLNWQTDIRNSLN